MHAEAYEGFGWMLEASKVDPAKPLKILDLGGQDVNGTVHDYFTHKRTQIVTVDIENADVIADATVVYLPSFAADVVISTEAFEHIQDWRGVIRTAWIALKPGGHLIATCASTDRGPHGMTGSWEVPAGEWYGNVSEAELRDYLGRLFEEHDVTYRYPPGDAYLWARKGE